MSQGHRQAAIGVALWWLVSLMLGLPAWWLGWVPLDQSPLTWSAQAQALAMHPDQGWHQPFWTWWSTAWLHGSALHQTRNLMALALIALLGTFCQASPRAALAWCLAWPLTQLGMLRQPEPLLHTYIGMSGVLHAGVAVLAMQQLHENRSRWFKWTGWALLLGLIFKILMENPWQHSLIQTPGSDINVAPWAHLSGAVAGISLYWISLCYRRTES